MTCDSADRARVEEVVKAAAEKYGTVDVVVITHRLLFLLLQLKKLLMIICLRHGRVV